MKYFVAFIVLVALVVGGYGLFHPSPKVPAPSGNHYESTTYGIAFFYPDGFTLTETDTGNTERAHHVITIVRDEATTTPQNGEGPTSVSIDIYDNTLDKATLVAWVTGSNFSNYKLGSSTIASTTVAGIASATYRWSGLYEGETTAFIHNEGVVAVSGTFMDPRDPVVLAYRMVLSTMELH